MNQKHLQVWSNCLTIIEKNVNPQSYKTWFKPIKPVRLDGDALTIQVPNKFFYEFLEERYVPVLKKAIRDELGPKGRLEYQIFAGEKRPAAATKQGNHSGRSPMRNPSSEITNPFVIPGIKKPPLAPQLNEKYTFEHFIEGDCNSLARNAGLAIADKPGGTAFNPLYVYGDVALGKTHLAQAIGNKALEVNPDTRVLYVSTGKFTNQIIQAIKKDAVNDFMNFYFSIDLLIVDDIHFLAGRKKTQEIFFNIFNQLQQSGRQIVLTSDRPPKELKDLEERLISRFKWGLTADLTPPDFETRMAILQAKLDRDGLDLSDGVLEFLCYNIKSNIRELEGALIMLNAQASLNKREVDLDLAKEVVQKMIREVNHEITIENIQAIVAEEYDIKVAELVSKTRKQPIATARQVAMYISKLLTKNTMKSIGQNFGNRDHTTVIYSCKAIRNMMDIDEGFKKDMQELEKKVRMSLHG
jgi:chromosomal replication initiator protein